MAPTSTADPQVIVEQSAEALATDVAARVVAILSDAISERGYASLVLTGGSILEQVFARLADDPAALEWAKVDVFWGDERFVAAGTEDRNDLAVEHLLTSRLPFDPDRIHRMPSSDGPDGDDLEAAARSYASLLAEVAARSAPGDDPEVPPFDVALIGVGPDGHCCSLFPDHPATREEKLAVVGVHGSPKPPPARISLSFRGLQAAQDVWVIASGAGKADAVAQAIGGADRVKIPSAGARGKRRTLWLLDREAAGKLPT